MARRDLHVVPHESGWAVRHEGAETIESAHRTQGEAEHEAKRLAQAEHVEVVIHGRDGRIRDSDSFGSDPTRSRDARH